MHLSSLLLGIVLSVCTCWFHYMVTLSYWLISTDCGTCWYQCSLSNFTPIFLYIWRCGWAHTIMSLCTVLLQILDLLIWCGLLCRQIVVDIVCIWCLFLSAVFLLHDILFVILGLDSQRNVSPSLISCLFMILMYWHCITLFSHFFFMDCPSLAHVCCILSCFVSLFSFDWLNSLWSCCCFNCWIHIWLIDFMAFNSIYKLVLFVFSVHIFCNINYLCFIYYFNL
jgi:hypothetical protein